MSQPAPTPPPQPTRVVLDGPADFAGWRTQARRLALAGVPPEAITWSVGGATPGLFAEAPPEPPQGAVLNVPRAFVDLAEIAIRHSDPERFGLLYRLLWRLRDTPALLHIATDADVVRAQALAKSVRRDAHKMHAFVRFREVATPEGPHFIAWFEPEHHILHAEAGFFVRRFATMRWSILTPEASAHWDTEHLTFGPGGRRQDAPTEDAAEPLWLAYFASIFNPARLKPAAMRAEMPQKYWKNLPEAALIPELMEQAPRRVAEMVARGASPAAAQPQRDIHLAAPRGTAAAAAGLPAMLAGPDLDDRLAAIDALPDLREAARGCRNCPLWQPATQTVFGAGNTAVPLMFVGEQPGDEEDLKGLPFVGPAGRLWDRALAEAGIDRTAAYVTNSVKHFKFTPTGKRRIHQKPDSGEIEACRPWLRREIALVDPRLVVALGATAIRALTGKTMPVGKLRGETIQGRDGKPVFVTVHPSYLLRLPDAAAKAEEYRKFVGDLRRAAALVA